MLRKLPAALPFVGFLLATGLTISVSTGCGKARAASAGTSKTKASAAQQKNGKPPIVLASAKPEPPKPDPVFDQKVVPFLKKYCLDCHEGADAQAGIDVSLFKTKADCFKHRAQWEKILYSVREELMPPADEKTQPTTAERTPVTDWVDRVLLAVDCNGPRNPGRVTVRRLNRVEYDNTIRDLVGIDHKAAADFPSDDVGYGFDNIGDVLSMPPILLEKYMAAAEAISEKAIQTPELTPPPFARYEAEKVLGGRAGGPGDFHILGSTAEVAVEHVFPEAGDYLLRTKAYGDQAGDEPCKMGVVVDGKQVAVIDVPNRVDAPKDYQHKITIPAKGKHRVAMGFLNDFWKPDEPNPSRRDRNLYLDYVDVVGPLGKPPSQSSSHKLIVFRTPGEKKPAAERAAAQEVLGRFAKRAFRRPLQAGELDRFLKVYDLVRDEKESFERGIQVAVGAVLVSPHFLFRVERDPAGVAPGATYTLSEHELASRLSYFLWSTMPDEELTKLADSGQLRQGKNLENQVRRMLTDPKSEELVENFAMQWLHLRNLQIASPNRRQFPTFDENLRKAMEQETELFFGHVMREDRSVLELLSADYTFLNEPLAKHYKIPDVKGGEFRKVSLKPDSHRGGILTQASVLTVTSNPTRTSPVKRGRWVLEQILGAPPPPPPPNVPELEEAGKGKKKEELSLRQLMDAHRKNPACASCHVRMDGLGFGLENFDAVGAWRSKDGKFDVDASGSLPGAGSFKGPDELKKILLTKEKEFRRNLATRLTTYALGRGVEYYDRCTIDEIVAKMGSQGNRFSSLILAIVESPPFQQRTAPGGN